MVASKLSGLKGLINNAAMEEAAAKNIKCKWRSVQSVVVSSAVVLCLLLYASRFSAPTPYGATGLFGPRAGGDAEEDGGALVLDNQVRSPCSSLLSHSICCDRSDYNADACFMVGDVRTDAASLSLLLFPPQVPAPGATAEEERIRPYTRKWDGKINGTIPEVRLRVARPEEAAEHRCDVRHDAPVLVMTAGGYNHNYFHAFNDGFLPSWLMVQHLRRRVVLAVLAYNPRWAGTYKEIISGLSGYHVIDLLKDKRTHCFPGAIVGTRFHGYLTVDPARLRDKKTIVDFHQFLAGVYESSQQGSKPAEIVVRRRPRLGIVSRRGTRVIENQAAVTQLATSMGFDVDILETPANDKPLSAVYASVSACDALVGVHGSDMTSFLLLRGGAAVTQIAPLGLAQLSRDLFGTPALKMGLHYEQYDVRGHESSLSRRYSLHHVVVADPERAKLKQGSSNEWEWDWDFIGRVYLDGQNVSLDLARFRETLARTHSLLLQQQERV
ncbi:xylan glycosyltransferase MUCI21-like [Phragmites australis]|uniref:xylan glycosyltransferase MUCI21-like n=1 Tax=Phragmites australis TaxID=29695 RepID=UPI002D764F99|nr:xylan glycosyltransferase MUCI21-like [Phragmites australis]